MSGGRGGRIVAAFSSIISRRNKICDALRRGLFGEAIAERQLGIGGIELATAEALGHDIGKIIFNDIDLGEVDQLGCIGGELCDQILAGVVGNKILPG